MTWVSVSGVRVGYGATPVLSGIDLDIEQGSLVAVLGPSGCGKTTLLRAITGLIPVEAGEVRVGDRLLSAPGVLVAPEARGIGWVPQDASLFPHLSVADNIGFGLPRAERRGARVRELARLVGLEEYLDRAPAQLSGGQAQRVSLARALAPRPDLVLLDEPFAALDPMLRVSLRREVAEVLRDQNTTGLLVTHDQEEALSLADRVAVMAGGRILQWGTPAEVYGRPATPWVASFVGDTVELDGVWAGMAAPLAASPVTAWGTPGIAPRVDAVVDCALGRLPVSLADAAAATPAVGARVRVVLRPEWLALTADPSFAETVGLSEFEASGERTSRPVPATVTAVSYGGHDALVSLELVDGTVVRARVPAPVLPVRGDRVHVAVRQPGLVYSADAAATAGGLTA